MLLEREGRGQQEGGGGTGDRGGQSKDSILGDHSVSDGRPGNAEPERGARQLLVPRKSSQGPLECAGKRREGAELEP